MDSLGSVSDRGPVMFENALERRVGHYYGQLRRQPNHAIAGSEDYIDRAPHAHRAFVRIGE